MASRNDLLSPEYIGEVRQHFIFCKGKCVGVASQMEIVFYITGTEIVAGSSPVGNPKTFSTNFYHF